MVEKWVGGTLAARHVPTVKAYFSFQSIISTTINGTCDVNLVLNGWRTRRLKQMIVDQGYETWRDRWGKSRGFIEWGRWDHLLSSVLDMPHNHRDIWGSRGKQSQPQGGFFELSWVLGTILFNYIFNHTLKQSCFLVIMPTDSMFSDTSFCVDPHRRRDFDRGHFPRWPVSVLDWVATGTRLATNWGENIHASAKSLPLMFQSRLHTRMLYFHGPCSAYRQFHPRLRVDHSSARHAWQEAPKPLSPYLRPRWLARWMLDDRFVLQFCVSLRFRDNCLNGGTIANVTRSLNPLSN